MFSKTDTRAATFAMLFIFVLISSSFVSVSHGQYDVANRESYDIAISDYEEVEWEDVPYDFEEGDRFTKVIFDMEECYKEYPGLDEETLDVRITETSLAHGPRGKPFVFAHEFKHTAVPEKSDWKLKVTKKGKRELQIKVKKYQEGLSWGDPFKEQVEGKSQKSQGGALSAKEEKKKKAKSGRKASELPKEMENVNTVLMVIGGFAAVILVGVCIGCMLMKPSSSAPVRKKKKMT